MKLTSKCPYCGEETNSEVKNIDFQNLGLKSFNNVIFEAECEKCHEIYDVVAFAQIHETVVLKHTTEQAEAPVMKVEE